MSSPSALEIQPLSKFQYLLGLQCHKAIWLRTHSAELADPVSPLLQLLLQQGTEVGKLARQRWPKGRLIQQVNHHAIDRALRETRVALAQGAGCLFEAAFEHSRVRTRCDVLIGGSGGWDLVEVKSSTKVKDEHIEDLALQRWVLEGCGLVVRKTLVLHVNTTYRRNGPVNAAEFFTAADVTTRVMARIDKVANRVRDVQRVTAAATVPRVTVGPHCEKPYTCPFKGHCWRVLPEDSIHNLGRVSWKKRVQLRELGVLHVRDVPDEFKLTEAQRHQVRVKKSGQPRFEREAIARLLSTLKYPLHFLDFETVNPAIPPYDNLKPYQKLPFLASVRTQPAPCDQVVHTDYLGDGSSDPRASLAEFLSRTIAPQGAVVVYNKSFEGSCLRELAECFPQHAKRLLSIKSRLWDLADPFRYAYYMHPAFQGRWSIKAVLPVLASGMSYESLAISDGGQASAAYVKVMRGELTRLEKEQLTNDLRRYCAHDTLAMVVLLKKLLALVHAQAGLRSRYKQS